MLIIVISIFSDGIIFSILLERLSAEVCGSYSHFLV